MPVVGHRCVREDSHGESVGGHIHDTKPHEVVFIPLEEDSSLDRAVEDVEHELVRGAARSSRHLNSPATATKESAIASPAEPSERIPSKKVTKTRPHGTCNPRRESRVAETATSQ
jgi:hypothetical protein